MVAGVSPPSPVSPEEGSVQNPFKPTAGATPPELVGRAGLLDEFE
ncbi:hypothetical protein [Arthrobacter sp. Z1-9]